MRAPSQCPLVVGHGAAGLASPSAGPAPPATVPGRKGAAWPGDPRTALASKLCFPFYSYADGVGFTGAPLLRGVAPRPLVAPVCHRGTGAAWSAKSGPWQLRRVGDTCLGRGSVAAGSRLGPVLQSRPCVRPGGGALTQHPQTGTRAHPESKHRQRRLGPGGQNPHPSSRDAAAQRHWRGGPWTLSGFLFPGGQQRRPHCGGGRQGVRLPPAAQRHHQHQGRVLHR